MIWGIDSPILHQINYMKKKLFWLLCFIYKHDEQLFWAINEQTKIIPEPEDDGESEYTLFERIGEIIGAFDIKDPYNYLDVLISLVMYEAAKLDKTECSTNKFW